MNTRNHESRTAGWPSGMTAACLLIGLLAAGLSTTQAHAVIITDPVGTEAYGEARDAFYQCTTCPIPTATLSNLHVGSLDNGVSSAAVAYSTPGAAVYQSSVRLVGGNALPELKAYAYAATSPGDPIGFYTHSVFTGAAALQQYTYTGAAPMAYEITFSMDGVIMGDWRKSASGRLAVYGADYDPNDIGGGEELFLDGGGSGPIDSASIYVNGDDLGDGVQPFDLSDSVGLLLDPGDVFYLQAEFDVYASTTITSTAPGYVDARNTFTTVLTAGDSSLLTPLLPVTATTIPEPSGLVLFATGLAGLGALSQRRREGKRAAIRTSDSSYSTEARH